MSSTRHAHDAARQVVRIAAAVEHAREPVQRAHPDRCRAPPCAAPRSGRRTARRPCRNGGVPPAATSRTWVERRWSSTLPSRASRQFRDHLEHAQRAARVAVAGLCDERRVSASSSMSQVAVRRDRARIGRARGAVAATMSSTPQRAQHVHARARQQRAELTSNEGFSVVAPMKMSVPSSTYGRKVSCCALLKRCTSSRNSTVRGRARRARLRASLDRGAHILDARQHRRELHGTPHRPGARSGAPAWSCRCPAGPRGSSSAAGPLERTAQRLAGARADASWPTNSSRVRGRMRSASGRSASSSRRRRAAGPAGVRHAGAGARSHRAVRRPNNARARGPASGESEPPAKQAQCRADAVRQHIARVAIRGPLA